MIHRSGYIAICGRPSTGKSTLLNRILKTKLSIVSPKPQTTRHKILGILNEEHYQAVFVDTPGWLDVAKDQLQWALRHAAISAAREEADIVLWIADAPPMEADLDIVHKLQGLGKPLVLALNKADLSDAGTRLTAAESSFKTAAAWNAVFRISALQGRGVEALTRHLVALLPESPPYFPKDRISDRLERFFALEIIRESIFGLFGEEIPHACAVELEQYHEQPGEPDRILATVLVEKDSQKTILVGRAGRAIQRLRETSEKAIESFLGRPVELELWVKVRKNWRQDSFSVKYFGYGSGTQSEK